MGTLINMIAILIGGAIGLLGKSLMNEKIQETLMKANGLCVIFIGLSGAIQKMLYVEAGTLNSQGTVVLIGTFAVGALIGEWIDLERHIERFGIWLREKSGNSNDKSFLNGFLTASFTVSIGAMAIVGSIQDGMLGDHSTLITKAILDFLIVMVMAASLGKGCLFSAIPVGILQGSVTLFAKLIAPFMNDQALNYISMTGSILIFCVGVNLIRKDTFKVANMLPVVLVAAIVGMIVG